MFSYRRHKEGNVTKVDAGSFLVLTSAMIHHEWCPVALTMDNRFSEARYYGFELDADKAEPLKKALANRAHVLALSNKDPQTLYLVLPAAQRFTDEQEYKDSISRKLTYPSLQGAQPIMQLQEKVRNIISFSPDRKAAQA